MGHRIEAGDLITDIVSRSDLPIADVLALFQDAPLDFPVIFSSTLPLQAHRFGMVGITLRGSVWLLNRARELSPLRLLALIRHEAEHVQQQRKAMGFFYPRYGLSWLGNMLNPFPNEHLRAFRKEYGRSYAAYRAIPYEIEAYLAGDRYEEELRHLKTKRG